MKLYQIQPTKVMLKTYRAGELCCVQYYAHDAPRAVQLIG